MGLWLRVYGTESSQPLGGTPTLCSRVRGKGGRENGSEGTPQHSPPCPHCPSLLTQGSDLPLVEPFPQPIMKWTETFYNSVFKQHGEFRLRENGEGAFKLLRLLTSA